MVTLQMASCSWLRTDPKKATSLNPRSLDLRCLSEAPARLSELFAGIPARTPELFSCLDRTLLAFASHTRGENPDSYSLTELRTFANRNLPADHPVSPAFARSLFQIKRSLGGGSGQSLLKSEIDILRGKLSRLGALLAPLSSHLPVLTRSGAGLPEERRKAGLALASFMEGLSELLSDSPNPLAWRELRGFFRELEDFSEKNARSILPLIIELIPVFQCLKLLLVGGEEEVIESRKWGPILRSISHFYGTLLVTRNPPELLEHLSLEVVSTKEEQVRATGRLTALLKTMTRDESLRSSSILKTLADRYAKALLLNAIAFPGNEGSLALQPFLGTSTLRKLVGELILAATRIRETMRHPERLQVLADQAASIIEQAALTGDGRPGGEPPTLHLGKLMDFYGGIEPLLDSADSPIIRNILRMIGGSVPLLIGKDADALSPRDLRSLIQKALDLALLWRGNPSSNSASGGTLSTIAGTIGILSRPPRAALIPFERIRALIEEIHLLLPDLVPDPPALLEKLRSALHLKSLLLGGPSEGLSGRELDQLAYLSQSFPSEEGISSALLSLSNLLRNRSFRNCTPLSLLTTLEPLLPASARPWIRNASGQFRDSALGTWKSILAGGPPDQISGAEWVNLTRLAGLLLHESSAPPDPGLNSETAASLRTVLLHLRENRRGEIPLPLLRDGLLEILRIPSPRVRSASLETLLIGLHTRVIRNLRTPKPRSIEGLVIPADDLTPWIELIDQISSDLKPLEAREERWTAVMGRILPYVYRHYSPGGNPDVAELEDLLSDLNPLAFDLGLTWGYTPASVSAPSRRRTIDLLTRAGNGDRRVDPGETIEFLTLARAGRKILDRAVRALHPACLPGIPAEDLDGFPQNCFNRNFFQEEFLESLYGNSLPRFLREIRSLDDAAFRLFQEAMYRASVSPSSFLPSLVQPESPSFLSRSELESLVAVPVFLENLFGRFDINQDDRLVFSEAMQAFPLFCREIQEAAGPRIRGSCKTGEDPDQVEAIFGHLLFRKEAPRGVRPGDPLWLRLRSARDLFGWFRFWNQLDRDAPVRDASPPAISRGDLLTIISKLTIGPGRVAPDTP
jgi:hypothetical protein